MVLIFSARYCPSECSRLTMCAFKWYCSEDDEFAIRGALWLRRLLPNFSYILHLIKCFSLLIIRELNFLYVALSLQYEVGGKHISSILLLVNVIITIPSLLPVSSQNLSGDFNLRPHKDLTISILSCVYVILLTLEFLVNFNVTNK